MTDRMFYALLLASHGYTDAGIADELGLTLEAVKTRMKRVLAYYNARNRTDAVAKAIRAGDL